MGAKLLITKDLALIGGVNAIVNVKVRACYLRVTVNVNLTRVQVSVKVNRLVYPSIHIESHAMLHMQCYICTVPQGTTHMYQGFQTLCILGHSGEPPNAAVFVF